MKISVVIAAYDEAENIGPLTARLISTLDAVEGASWELIYVIEGTDGTRSIAESFANQRREIRILYNPEPSGLANAFRKGFAAVSTDTDVVVTMDADLNHQPEEIPRLMSALFTKDASIVVGSRKVEGSAISGTPLWKRTLSDAGNRYMRAFLGMPVSDMTSGYRIYRYQAVRDIAFSSTGFAFLPEILMNASAAGHKIIEEPIQFIFRVAGESKMMLWSTTLSYLRLFFARSFSFSTLAAILVMIAALVVLCLIAFPVHKYRADADGVLAGLCAIRVLHGSHPVFFPGGYRLGAQSCYVTAMAFSLFGISRQSLALTGILFSSMFVVFMYLYLREAFGPRASIAGLVMAAFPPLSLLINTYVAWAYGEILMYCASSLWLGTFLARRKPRNGWFLIFGLSVGLALWCSIQSLMITLPVILWLVIRRVLNSIEKVVWAVVGVVFGSSPIWIFLINGGFSRMFGDAAIRTASTTAQVLSNISYLFSTELPWLLAEGQAHAVILSLYAAALLLCIYFALGSGSPLRKQPQLFWQAVLLSLVVLCCCGLYVFSAAGSVRGWTVRYILPIYLVIPGMMSLLSRTLKRTWVIVLGLAIGFILFAYVREYPFITSPVRKSLQVSLSADAQLIEWLRQNQIQAVLGGYWDVYGLNFDSTGAVLGIPVESTLDYFDFANKLSNRRIKWAIIDHTPQHLVAWQHRLNSRGDVFPMGPEHFVFVPKINPPCQGAERFLQLARATDPN